MYSYTELKPTIFTEKGQVRFLKIRDHATELLEDAGAFMLRNCISVVHGDSWERIACVDRLVELGEIKEVTKHGVPWQLRVFVAA